MVTGIYNKVKGDKNAEQDEFNNDDRCYDGTNE